MFDDVINFLKEFYNTYKIISIIILIFVAIFFIAMFYNTVSPLFKDAKTSFKSFFKRLFKVLKYIAFLPYYVIKLPFTIYKKIKRRHELIESVYNVLPSGKIKIPRRYYIFSFKIRKQARYRLKCIEKCIETEEKINNTFKYITMIEASIGGGKTSFLNAFAHVKTINLKKQIEEDLYTIERKIFDFDYYILRAKIKNLYLSGYTEKQIFDELKQNNKIKEAFIVGEFDDHISLIPREALLKDYITAYCALIRNNYIMSNYKMYCRITNTFNYDFDSSVFNIRNEDSQKKFYIPKYIVIVDDEKALSMYKNTENAKNLDNLGADVVYRLFRQMSKEKSFYISSTQNTSRIALILRELANTYISIEKFSIVGEQNALANRYRKKEDKLLSKMKKYARKHFKEESEQEKFLLNNNSFKPKIFDYFMKEKELFSSAFIKYNIKLSSKLNSLANNIDCISLSLVFPLTFAYGVYNTCEYSEFNEFLNNLSDIKSDHDLHIIKSLYQSDEDRYKILIEDKIKLREQEKLLQKQKAKELKNRLKLQEEQQ